MVSVHNDISRYDEDTEQWAIIGEAIVKRASGEEFSDRRSLC